MNAFLLLCRCLSTGDGQASSIDLQGYLAQTDTVRRLIATADQEMLAPALWLALQRKNLTDSLPDAVRGALQRRYQMNAILNERIRAEADHVAEICRGVGVTPVALKGGAFLYEAGQDTIGARAMRDLDVLIPEASLQDVADAMMKDGYRIKDGEDEDWNYAFPALERSGGIVAVELHRYVGQQRNLLRPEAVWPDVRPLDGSGGTVQSLSPTHRVWHNVFHSQIQDRGHLFAFVWLRQLLDLAEICGRHTDDIDWEVLEGLFASAGLGHILPARLYQAQKLLGLAWPLAVRPGLRAKTHHRRSIFIVRSRWALWLSRLAAGITAPLKKYHLDLLYNCGTDSFWRLLRWRIKHTFRVIQSYRGSVLRRVWERRKYDV